MSQSPRKKKLIDEYMALAPAKRESMIKDGSGGFLLRLRGFALNLSI